VRLICKQKQALALELPFNLSPTDVELAGQADPKTKNKPDTFL